MSSIPRAVWGWAPVVTLGITLAATAPILVGRYSPDPAAPSTELGRVTVVGAGDILVHPPTWEQAAADAGREGRYEFGRILDAVRPVVSAADVALCHMEAPMQAGPPRDFPRFRLPPEMAGTVAALGFDGCSTASNHSLDQGESGLSSTLAVLDEAGVRHAGTARTEAEAARPVLYRAGSATVGHLSATFGLNRGMAVPAGKAWMVNRLEADTVLDQAARLRQAGADIVVLSAHWGTEQIHEVSPRQRELARRLASSPNIDLIIGHHAHVVQPAELVAGKWVFYGVGNLLARHDFPTPDNKSGVLPRVTFGLAPDGRWRAVRAEVVPVWLSLAPVLRVVVLSEAAGKLPDADRRKWKYEDAWQATARFVDGFGARASGLVVAGS